MPSIQKVTNAYKMNNQFTKNSEIKHFVDKYDDKNNATVDTNRNDVKKSFEEILKEKQSKDLSRNI